MDKEQKNYKKFKDKQKLQSNTYNQREYSENFLNTLICNMENQELEEKDEKYI